jgi:electron transport complex protein RnfE
VSGARDGFIPNPVLAGLVGICPLVVAASSLASGLAYGLGVALCATALGLIVPSARSLIPDRLQAPATLALSAALALIYGYCLRIYSPVIAQALWIYLPLLAVSALSLKSIKLPSTPGRFGPDGKSRLGTIAFESLLFLLTSAFVGALRELIGLGTLTLPLPGFSPARRVLLDFEPLRILVSPAGGFILLGFLVALHRAGYRARRKLAHSAGRKAS